MKKKANSERFTENGIQRALDSEFLSNPKFLIHNLYVFAWESDYLAKTKAGYWYEVEIKISLSDFKADFKKTHRHYALKKRGWVGKDAVPNYFSYCVPKPLMDKVRPLVPDYAGLIGVNEYGHIIIDKAPPKLHPVKIQDSDLNLVDKFYFSWKGEKRKNLEHDAIVRCLKYQISALREEYKRRQGTRSKKLYNTGARKSAGETPSQGFFL